jgi:CcmD family protein
MKKLVAALLALPAAVAAAQPPSQPQGGFVPIDQLPAPEAFPAAPLVIAAYAVAWLVIFFYVWSVWRRVNRVEAELKNVLKRSEPRGRP